MKQLAELCDLVLVIGSKLSSNSNRLREVGEAYGKPAFLIMSPEELKQEWFTSYDRVGITSGASTPEPLVEAIVGELLKHQPNTPIQVLEAIKEEVHFMPPRDLIQLAMAAN